MSTFATEMGYEQTLRDAPFTRRQRVDRDVHTLEGIIKGIAIDHVIAAEELRELRDWVRDHSKLVGQHPFTELVPRVEAALADGKIDEEEHSDILWLCQNLSSDSVYYDHVTSDLQRLQGILHGLLADGRINDDEIRGLSLWMDEHSYLRRCYPYDEIDTLLTQVLRDRRIDDQERRNLASFFEDFVNYSVARQVQNARSTGSKRPGKLTGLCAVQPTIEFSDRVFCVTGASERARRAEMARIITSHGGHFSQGVGERLDYLVVCSHDNPAWAYTCYGRKVEQAMELRSVGRRLLLVHESDFWDAVEDRGVHGT